MGPSRKDNTAQTIHSNKQHKNIAAHYGKQNIKNRNNKRKQFTTQIKQPLEKEKELYMETRICKKQFTTQIREPLV